jgi:hypothetical protein
LQQPDDDERHLVVGELPESNSATDSFTRIGDAHLLSEANTRTCIESVAFGKKREIARRS